MNFDLVHYLEFEPHYAGATGGMLGAVEAMYGKGNVVYFEENTEEGAVGDPVRYYLVRGLNRIWATSEKTSETWSFLPSNFNERGGGAAYMGVDAMLAAFRHRKEYDPFWEQR